MAKKHKKRTKSTPSHQSKTGGATRRRSRGRFLKLKTWELGVLAVIAGLVIWAVATEFSGGVDETAFLRLAAQGRERLSDVVSVADAGNAHIPDATYASDYPTTGPHNPNPLSPGFYSSEQRPDRLVHSLEHGMIVIYYDEPGDDIADQLRDWAALYRGPWSGVIVTKKKGQGPEIVLAAWRNLLRLPTFEPTGAAAFVDRFRGRGPENPVR
ncbi:MAG: DUF3105 domain-containing protein [Proteobacteria bacterium]|nr:DUF3105 domain-containing protein [Pseudomonadota bacterium]MDA1058714.1 DUF3105 domain-containing protein [Pseudomonadota bacterium]